MYSFMLQDWITQTVHDSILTGVTQSEADWMSFQAYQDIFFHTEVKAFDKGGADQLVLAFQTSPSKDESMFKDMATFNLDTAGVNLSKVILSTNPDVPLSRWVRWVLRPSGSPATPYSATFRILVSANAVGPL